MLLKGGGITAAPFVLLGGVLLITGPVCGCNSGVAKPEPVSITGTVTTSDGAPLGGVRLVLIPKSENLQFMLGFDLDHDGHFEGEAIPGVYGFYFAPIAVERDEESGLPVDRSEATKLKDSNEILNKLVPPAYRTRDGAGANEEVEVTAGAEITFELSQK